MWEQSSSRVSQLMSPGPAKNIYSQGWNRTLNSQICKSKQMVSPPCSLSIVNLHTSWHTHLAAGLHLTSELSWLSMFYGKCPVMLIGVLLLLWCLPQPAIASPGSPGPRCGLGMSPASTPASSPSPWTQTVTLRRWKLPGEMPHTSRHP